MVNATWGNGWVVTYRVARRHVLCAQSAIMNATALLDRHDATRQQAEPLRHTGITCTIGPSRVRHAALLIPDERGRARLVPACKVPVDSWHPEGRVLPYLFSNVVTCKRGGCKGHASPPEYAPQLMLDLDLG